MESKLNEINRELSQLRNDILNKYGLSCETCAKKNGKKCKSKVYCIVKDNVFFCAYVAKQPAAAEK